MKSSLALALVRQDPLILDSISGAKAAFSLFRLRKSYVGNCVKVRRSSDDTEQDIGFVGNRIDTASLLTFCGSGDGFVTTWYDQSGLGHNAVQATNSKQPQIVDNGEYLGELKFVVANSNCLLIPYHADLQPTDVIGFGGVFRHNNWNDTTIMALMSNTSVGGYSLYSYYASTDNFTGLIRANAQYQSPVKNRTTAVKYLPTDDLHIFATYDGQYSRLYVNGVLANTVNAGAAYPILYSTHNSYAIGAQMGNAAVETGNYFEGGIKEVIILNTILTDALVSSLYRNARLYGQYKTRKNVNGYIRAEADVQIATAKALQTGNYYSFGYWTDPHFRVNWDNRDLYVMNYVKEQMGNLDFWVSCGDNLENGGIQTKQIVMGIGQTVYSLLRFKKYFPVKGNHDDNAWWTVQEHHDIENTILPEELYNIQWKRLEGIVNFDPGDTEHNPYFYYDNPTKKIRSIFLNSSDVPYMASETYPDAWKYSCMAYYAFRNAQLQWLAHTALDLPDNTWKVLVFVHISPLTGGVYNANIVKGILRAFKTGISYSATQTLEDFEVSLSVDYSGRGAGNLIGVFCGHTHIETITTDEGIIYYTGDCDYLKDRSQGTVDEPSMGIVTINFDTNKIHITKVGYGDDQEISFVL